MSKTRSHNFFISCFVQISFFFSLGEIVFLTNHLKNNIFQLNVYLLIKRFSWFYKLLFVFSSYCIYDGMQICEAYYVMVTDVWEYVICDRRFIELTGATFLNDTFLVSRKTAASSEFCFECSSEPGTLIENSLHSSIRMKLPLELWKHTWGLHISEKVFFRLGS